MASSRYHVLLSFALLAQLCWGDVNGVPRASLASGEGLKIYVPTLNRRCYSHDKMFNCSCAALGMHLVPYNAPKNKHITALGWAA